MPQKGFFTQGSAILLSRAPDLDELVPLLCDFSVIKRIDEAGGAHKSGPSLLVAFRPEVNGYIEVDVNEGPWPDHMGDVEKEPQLFGAWSMGFFGPFAFPGGLERAAQQSWGWSAGKDVPAQHRAFVRVRSSYVFGASEDAKVLPEDYDALAELRFVTRACRALLEHPAALACFNPNGETLLGKAGIDDSLSHHGRHDLSPLDLWSNVRLLNPGNGWMIMDTVGMGQLDLPDLEACFPKEAYQPNAVANFLRNCCFYLLSRGEVINHGDTMNGPGEINWRGYHVEKELCPPPRRLIRWFPLDGSTPPPEMMAPPKAKPAPKKSWKFWKKG